MISSNRPTYLDSNATTQIEPQVLETVIHYLQVEYGNAGSRTHEYGATAKKAVQSARDQVAEVVRCKREEVIFTSGATESNNIALLGFKSYAEKTGKKHIITTSIEHKAVLEPLEELEKEGFEVSYALVDRSGRVKIEALAELLREDTLLVSVMHVNNETGIIQPIEAICELLKSHDAFFHTDAAQGFGKLIGCLQNPRIDLISLSGHKIHAPKGIGVLIARRRGYKMPPLSPLMYGGGQERKLRPGTLPVHLVMGLGKASELALKDNRKRRNYHLEIRQQILDSLKDIPHKVTGDQQYCVPHVLSFSVRDIDSEAMIVALKGKLAISNGSACTSTSYTPSHVLTAMGYSEDEANCVLRLSWDHNSTLTEDLNSVWEV